MIILLIGAVAIGVPLWTMRRYEPPAPLTVSTALRYLLMCVAFFLLALLESHNPLMLAWWGYVMLSLSALFAAALVVVLGAGLCQD